MDQFEEAQRAAETATNSQGSAYRENEAYLDSYQAKLNQLSNAWTSLSVSMGENVIGDGLVLVADGLIGISKATEATVNTVGLLPPLFGLIGGAFLAFNNQTRTSIMQQGLLSSSLVRTGDSMKIATGAARAYQIQLYNMTLATRGAGAALGAMGTAVRGIGAFLMGAALPIAGFMALGAAISFATGKIMEHRQQQKEIREEIDKLTDTYRSSETQILSLVSRYEQLEKQMKSGQISETDKEYLDVQQKLYELLPSVAESVDAKGQAHLRSADAIREELGYLNDLAKIDAEKFITNFQSKLSDLNDQISETQRKLEEIQGRQDNGYKGLIPWFGVREKAQLEDMAESIIGRRDIEAKLEERKRLFQELGTSYATMYGTQSQLTQEDQKYIDTIVEKNNELLNSKKGIEEVETQVKAYIGSAGEIRTVTGDLFSSEEIQNFVNYNEDTVELFQTMSQAVKDGNTDWDQYKTSLEGVGITGDALNAVLDRLKNGQLDVSNSLKDSFVYIDEMGEGFETFADAISNAKDDFDALSDIILKMATSGQVNEATLTAQKEAYKALADEVSPLNELLEKTAQGKQISAAEAMELISQEKELAKAISIENGVIKINEKAVKTLRDAKIKSYNDMLESIKTEAILTANKTLQNLKNYGIEISAIQNLADAKKKLAEAESSNNDFYNNLAKGQVGNYNSGVGVLTSVTDQLQNIEDLQKVVSTGLEQVGTEAEKLSDKTSKAYETSIYVSDRFKASLEKVNLELEKQRKIQAQFPKHSQEYQKSLKSEISLLDQKKKLLQDQTKALDAQIKSGKIKQTGIVTTSNSSSSYSPASSYASGGSSSAQIWNFFKSKGFTDNIVAGIMGNLQLESGLNPNALNKSSGAFGIAQWLGGRKSGLSNYASSIGSSMNDLNTQLNFLWKELNSTEKRTLNYLNGNRGSSASNIAAAFDRLFERSEGTHIPQRQQYAQGFLSQFAGSGGGSVVASGSVSEAQSKASKEVAEGLQNVDQAKSELIQLKQDLLAIEAEIAEKQYQSIIGVLDVLDYRIRNIEYTYNSLEGKLDEYDPSSQSYRNTVSQMSDTLYQKQRNNASQINYVETIIKKGGLNPIQIDELTTKLQELRLEREALFDQQKDLSAMKVDSYITQYSDILDDINDKLELTQMKLGSLEEGTDEYNKVLADEIALLSERQEANKLQVKTIENMLKTQKLSIEKQKELQELIVDLNKQIQSDEYEKQNIVKESADAIIDILKKSIEKRRDIEVAALRKEIDEAEKAHEAKMEMYDEDLARYEEIVNRKLGLIDDQYQEDMYNKDLGKMQGQEADLQKQINRLMMDDSQEATAKRIELEKQLADLRDQIAQKQYYREIELRKDGLQDEMDRYKDEVEGKKDAEQEKFDTVKESLEKQIEQVNYHYNEMLADEQHFADLYKQIVSGNIEGIKGELTGFLDFFKGQNADLIKELGLSWNELGNLINGISGGMDGLGSIGAGSGSNSGTVNKAKEAAWKEYLNNKRLAESDPNATPARLADLRAANDRLRSIWGFPDGRYNDLKNLKKYHDGGVVGGGGSKLANIINSLANTIKPNEQIVKALKGEVMIPQKNMPNFVQNIAGALIPRPSVGGSGVAVGELIHIENFYGTKQEVDKLETRLVNTLKNIGKI